MIDGSKPMVVVPVLQQQCHRPREVAMLGARQSATCAEALAADPDRSIVSIAFHSP